MSLVAIENALEDRLKEMADLPEIAEENLVFKPTTNQPYLRINHLTNTPVNLYVEGGSSRLRGVVQVSVLVPVNVGTAWAKDLAQQIADHLNPVQVLDAGNHRVDIDDPPAIATGMPTGDGWYMVPVSINWQAFPK